MRLFEERFSEWLGGNLLPHHCLGVANGTEALELALRCAGVKPGAPVIVPSHTAYATTAAILRVGAIPKFVDISNCGSTLCPMRTQEILQSLPQVAAVVAVHLYGEACDLTLLQQICRDHNVTLIEDCAQAAGTTYQHQKVGTWGEFAAFSFYPTKNLGAVGDGGMLVINAKASEETITHARRMRFYGWDDHREAVQFGLNSRLDELQAWILSGKLAHLDEQIDARRRLADLYRVHLDAPAAEGLITLPKDGDHWQHSYHLFVVRMEAGRRNDLLQQASHAGIPLGVHYAKACHQHPYIIENFPCDTELPNTESAVNQVVSLPINPYLTDDDVAMTCEFVSNHLRS